MDEVKLRNSENKRCRDAENEEKRRKKKSRRQQAGWSLLECGPSTV
jgi:hypothetical protein